MGEYEPEDSRKVTLTDNRAPGEPPRTGPREDEARRKAAAAKAQKGTPMDEPQQKAQQQSQRQGGQSQSQSQSAFAPVVEREAAPAAPPRAPAPSPGLGERHEWAAQPSVPFAADSPQPVRWTVAAEAPDHGDDAPGKPQNMQQPGSADDRKFREQAAMQVEDIRGFGYGADGEEEMADAPDASEEEEPSPSDPETHLTVREEAGDFADYHQR